MKNMVAVLQRIEASLTIGSADEPAIREVMLKDVREALKQIPDMVNLLKDIGRVLELLRHVPDLGHEQKMNLDWIGEKTRAALLQLEPQFAHRVKDRWYFSTDLDHPPETLVQYRERVRTAYGDLHGVKFATRGIDYDEVGFNNHPVNKGKYI